MPPKVVPPKPIFRSDAEKATFDAIVKNLGDGDAIVCNLEIFDAQYGEVDVECRKLPWTWATALVVQANISPGILKT